MAFFQLSSWYHWEGVAYWNPIHKNVSRNSFPETGNLLHNQTLDLRSVMTFAKLERCTWSDAYTTTLLNIKAQTERLGFDVLI